MLRAKQGWELFRYVRPDGQAKARTPSSTNQRKPLHYFCVRAPKYVGQELMCILRKTVRGQSGTEKRESQKGMEGNPCEGYSPSPWDTQQPGLGWL